MKVVVERMDILTRKTFPKESLLRLVRVDDVLVLDKDQTMPGRGIYLLAETETVSRLRKKNLLLRYSKKTDYEKLFEEMEKLCR
ncbi:MAG TPA: YlxR family protein [Candidatus Enterosoma merdigallinarum]|nr:YlxR family protein [Candidatus Enterosoma merdigallinarum]